MTHRKGSQFSPLPPLWQPGVSQHPREELLLAGECPFKPAPVPSHLPLPPCLWQFSLDTFKSPASHPHLSSTDLPHSLVIARNGATQQAQQEKKKQNQKNLKTVR